MLNILNFIELKSGKENKLKKFHFFTLNLWAKEIIFNVRFEQPPSTNVWTIALFFSSYL
jgi:hypothetical protein